MSDCVFCKIVSGEIPCYQLYDDDWCLAFLDINPVNPGHLLVIPKQHYENVKDIPVSLFQHLMKVVHLLANALLSELEPDGLKIVQNNGKAAGQVVNHLHVHVIPRFKGDSNHYVEQWRTRKLPREQMVEIQQRIKRKV